MVAARRRDRLVDRAGAVPDLQLEVPEQIEDRLDRLLAPTGRLPRGDEGEVDIGGGEAAEGAEVALVGSRSSPWRTVSFVSVQLGGVVYGSMASKFSKINGAGKGLTTIVFASENLPFSPVASTY